MSDLLEPSSKNTRYFSERLYGVDRLPLWNRLAYIHRKLRQAIAGAIDELQLVAGEVVLDYGCANQQYKAMIPAGVQYLGADIAGNDQCDITIGEDGLVPLEDESCDAVLSTQVLEHVDSPDLYLGEAYRVLRPGGKLLITTHGIMVYHMDPVDYWRWTGAGLEKLLSDNGFRVARLDGIMGLAPVGLQMFQDAVFPKLPRLVRPAWALFLQALVAVFDRMHSPESRRKNAMVYLAIAYKDA